MARYIVYGAGAIGGSIGSSLSAAGTRDRPHRRGANTNTKPSRIHAASRWSCRTVQRRTEYRASIIPRRIDFDPDDLALLAVQEPGH